MNTQTQPQHSPEFNFRTNRPWCRSLVRSFRRWLAWRREQRRVMRSINDLLAMNDHLLSDIGLTREDIATGRTTGPRREGHSNELLALPLANSSSVVQLAVAHGVRLPPATARSVACAGA